MCKRIKDITSRDGVNTINLEYVTTLGLTGEEKIVDEMCVTRGTDYNMVYECLLESGDTFTYCTAGWSSFFVLGYPTLTKKSSKKDYANKVRALVKEYKSSFNISVGIGLTLGTDKEVYEYIKASVPFTVTPNQLHALTECGIDKRLNAIIEVLKTDTIKDLKLYNLGQTGSTRIANLIVQNRKRDN